ncbi:TonB-dependent receptor [Pseudomonas typographi]|uniref:TonB-dependent receptor n=1 Tax=Pseudomonas typographi TaxID=2715964 RepID=A0ABR7Z2E9_9PSED|nr:TonB-dependent receptor [Pseudomonas typographi]MBD1599568.1 TonB-dependent receptor [Pseudomonas typographi]
MVHPRRLRHDPLTQKTPLVMALALASVSLMSHAADAEPGQDGQAPIAGTDTRLDKVTVNARRREERAQDVPTPITVLDSQTLENQRIYRIQDLQQLAPSTNVAYQHARQASVSIRGLGNNPANDGLEGSVGLYLDNVYLGRPGMAVFDLLDVEQVDVLRGPQGTLFGKNTTAGVLNISTRKPSFTPERSIETSVGEHGYVQTKGSISGPLNDRLAGRLSLYRTREDGDTRNIFDGHDVNGGAREGMRGQLLWNINDDLNVRFIGDYNQEKSTYGSPTLYSVGPYINGSNRFLQRVASAGGTLASGNRKVNFDGDSTKTTFQGGASVEVNWRAPSDFTLTSITAYRWWDFTPNNDDGLDISVYRNNGVAVKDKQYSQEIRLASPIGDAYDYVVGAYYYRQVLNNYGATLYGSDADNFLGTAQGALANVDSFTNGHITTNSYALFGQLTLHLAPRLDLALGVRGTYEEKDAWVQRQAPTGGASVSGAAATARQAQLGAFDSGDLSQYSFSPSTMASLSYRFNDQLLGYTTLSHGEKSGGVNLAVGSARTAGAGSLLIGSERSNNLEVGLKSTLFDQRLLLNANLFLTRVTGYQATAYDPDVRANYLTNAGAVRSRGAELDATWQPNRNWTVNANASYNDVRYTSYKNASCAPEISYATGAAECDLSGATVPGASKWIANLNTHYQWFLEGGLQPYVNASYAFRSHTVGTLDNSEYSEIPSYAVVNLSTGLRGDLYQGQWDVSLWLKNAFDKTYATYVWGGSNGSYNASLGDSRTLGMTARYDF